MPNIARFPRNDYDFDADEVAAALSGFVVSGRTGAVKRGVLGYDPNMVGTSGNQWKVYVRPFVYVRPVGSTRMELCGRYDDNTWLDVAPSTGMTTGQTRRDIVWFNPSTNGLGVATGTPSTNPNIFPDPPSGAVRLAYVVVGAGDAYVINSKVKNYYEMTALSGDAIYVWEDYDELGSFSPRVGQKVYHIADNEFITWDKSGQWAQEIESMDAIGTVSKRVVGVGATTNVTVTFPADRFTRAPVVIATLWGDARDCNVQVDNITRTGFTLRLGSNAIVPRTIGAQWRASV